MITWLDIIKFVNKGNLAPNQRVEKTPKEWKALLTPEQYRITRKKGTEKAHSSNLCNLFDSGKYACVCCNTLLFDAEEKFKSKTSWPSFTQPISDNVIAYHKDISFGMYRVETICNTCDAHLGHVFQDGPLPSGLRFCINAEALKKIETNEKKATFGGGCFWCTEAIFQQLKGVISIDSGYSGGNIKNPTYKEVSSGLTGHAEVIEVVYDPTKISFEDLIQIHLTTHNPTIVHKKGADRGSQYRSIVFYRTEAEKDMIMKIISKIQKSFEKMIVTEVRLFESFYKAESYHQDYYISNPNKAYCQTVINPKLNKLKELYQTKLNNH